MAKNDNPHALRLLESMEKQNMADEAGRTLNQCQDGGRKLQDQDKGGLKKNEKL